MTKSVEKRQIKDCTALKEKILMTRKKSYFGDLSNASCYSCCFNLIKICQTLQRLRSTYIQTPAKGAAHTKFEEGFR
ncbi:unnamed protein product [Peronospora belbahrii]|uniref:Uncharacterized protein n=1 Tax=Peronospora belbahrii TaxID=622444 RepID=A0AAU9KVV3_9STRA|nr:unnamed protein product [Peronospora belbahrii]